MWPVVQSDFPIDMKEYKITGGTRHDVHERREIWARHTVTVSPWYEVPDLTWRERYEELRKQHGELLAIDSYVGPVPADDEIVVVGHRRHKPRKKASTAIPEQNDPEPASISMGASTTAVYAGANCDCTQMPDTPEGDGWHYTESQPETTGCGVTLWNCEGCGQVVDHYPCKFCGYPAASGEVTRVLYHNETDYPVRVESIDLTTNPPTVVTERVLQEPDCLGPTL